MGDAPAQIAMCEIRVRRDTKASSRCSCGSCRKTLLELARVRPARQIVPARTESATHVLVEPVHRALPGQIGCRFVIPFRHRVAIEAMYGARVNIAFVRNMRRVQ